MSVLLYSLGFEGQERATSVDSEEASVRKAAGGRFALPRTRIRSGPQQSTYLLMSVLLYRKTGQLITVRFRCVKVRC